MCSEMICAIPRSSLKQIIICPDLISQFVIFNHQSSLLPNYCTSPGADFVGRFFGFLFKQFTLIKFHVQVQFDIVRTICELKSMISGTNALPWDHIHTHAQNLNTRVVLSSFWFLFFLASFVRECEVMCTYTYICVYWRIFTFTHTRSLQLITRNLQ